ncbi:hypothetical protein BD626DRAFT_511828 [Schizophyllum amplum]|uniref:Transmembrane protein n=1 Tax=Schizophyllum amplum TaxID=97359 RepID=A0A550C109_9AGAR|nr:hypothetical protein BD626DRAFT_511828 [Auriculariopsis ampla]
MLSGPIVLSCSAEQSPSHALRRVGFQYALSAGSSGCHSASRLQESCSTRGSQAAPLQHSRLHLALMVFLSSFAFALFSAVGAPDMMRGGIHAPSSVLSFFQSIDAQPALFHFTSQPSFTSSPFFSLRLPSFTRFTSSLSVAASFLIRSSLYQSLTALSIAHRPFQSLTALSNRSPPFPIAHRPFIQSLPVHTVPGPFLHTDASAFVLFSWRTRPINQPALPPIQRSLSPCLCLPTC